MEGLTAGRFVHYVMPLAEGPEDHRPAIVVRVWDRDTGSVNLQVFTDGRNDGPAYAAGLFWATSVTPDPDGQRPGSWHWPERA